MKIKFRDVRLSKGNKEKLTLINSIIGEYQRQGLVLTLRQLYYQLVSRDVIPNQVAEYAKLSKLLKEGRMGGIVDWTALEDRLRKSSKPTHWESPAGIIRAALQQYRKDRMEGQETYIEVWVEKDALSGVLKRVTEPFGIPISVNRGYSSVTAVFDAYERFISAFKEDKKVKVIYLGDYDPSGLDMIRDIRNRVTEFFIGSHFMSWKFDSSGDDDRYQEYCERWLEENFEVIPIALTRKQIEQYNLPPNPAKKTDPRSKKFIAEFGGKSWEIDALKPEVLDALLKDNINRHIDQAKYRVILKEEEADKLKLQKLTDSF